MKVLTLHPFTMSAAGATSGDKKITAPKRTDPLFVIACSPVMAAKYFSESSQPLGAFYKESFIFPGSSCGSGLLTFGFSATLTDKSSFCALVMAQKVNRKRVGVVHDNATSACEIFNFYLNEDLLLNGWCRASSRGWGLDSVLSS